MISKYAVNSYCKDDICLIENYYLAVNSDEIWDCHHRNEIMNDGTLHSVKWLKDNGLYYNRPACELIFLSHNEHSSLHCRKCQNGKNNHMYGKQHSEVTRKKISETLSGRKYFLQKQEKKYQKHLKVKNNLKKQKRK